MSKRFLAQVFFETDNNVQRRKDNEEIFLIMKSMNGELE